MATRNRARIYTRGNKLKRKAQAKRLLRLAYYITSAIPSSRSVENRFDQRKQRSGSMKARFLAVAIILGLVGAFVSSTVIALAAPADNGHDGK
jgi:hypothetical protein